LRTHGETYTEAIETDKEAANIENKLDLPDKVDKAAYLMEIGAFTLMRLAYELLLAEKQEVRH